MALSGVSEHVEEENTGDVVQTFLLAWVHHSSGSDANTHKSYKLLLRPAKYQSAEGWQVDPQTSADTLALVLTHLGEWYTLQDKYLRQFAHRVDANSPWRYLLRLGWEKIQKYAGTDWNTIFVKTIGPWTNPKPSPLVHMCIYAYVYI